MVYFRANLAFPRDKLHEASAKAEHMLAVQILKDTAPYVPAVTGMSLDTRAYVDKDTVVYPGPGARYLYHGKLMIDPVTGSSYARKGTTKVLTDKDLIFSHGMHPQAQAYWFEASKAANKGKWIHIAGKAVADAI